jgi:tetratricopeptide (TPR) repeat protein
LEVRYLITGTVMSCFVSGVCYRTLGRSQEAEQQFRIALSLAPDLLSAQYNLGLVLQERHDWINAIAYFRNVTAFLPMFPNAIGIDKAIECKVRECDLLLAMQQHSKSLQCWKDGVALFPQAAVFYHELGDLQARVCLVCLFACLLYFAVQCFVIVWFGLVCVGDVFRH